jgi:hypothetical protein
MNCFWIFLSPSPQLSLLLPLLPLIAYLPIIMYLLEYSNKTTVTYLPLLVTDEDLKLQEQVISELNYTIESMSA